MGRVKLFYKPFLLTLVPLFIILFFGASVTRSAVTHPVISQVQLRSVALADDEFVELYNPTNSAIDLTSWKLVKKTEGGASSNLVSSMSGTINTKSYFLVATAEYTGATAKDLNYSTTNRLASNNTVILVDNSDTTVDKLGLGTATDFETAGFANPANGGSVQRKADDTLGHGLDTDNNSTDFEQLSVSTPRNSQVVVSPTPTPSVSPTPTPTQSPSPSPTLSPTPTQSSSPTASPSPTPTVSPTSSPTPEPTDTPEPTVSPTPSQSPTPTPSPTSTPKGILVGVFSFPSKKIECRVYYLTIHRGWFTAIFPSFICATL